MKELLELKSVLDKINPENDSIPLELLDELNETLQYALGWCKGWLTQRPPDDCPQGGLHVYKWDGTLPTEEMIECEKCGHRR